MRSSCSAFMSIASTQERGLLTEGMGHENTTQIVLRCAVDAVGSAEKLASALGISRGQLDAWMTGSGTPSNAVLMDALEVATYQAQLGDLPAEQRSR